MSKLATVIVSGRPPGENLVDIEIPSGATALDVLQAVGLDRNWTLSRENSNQVYAHEEDVFALIEPGCKLRAAPLAEVGWPRWVRRLFRGKKGVTVVDRGAEKPCRASQLGVALNLRVAPRKAIGPSTMTEPSVATSRVAAVPGRPSSRIRVERDRRSLAETRGWQRHGTRLVGAYRLGRRGAFAGEIDISSPRRPRFFIVAPPSSVLEGSHGACFRRRGRGRYEVHFGIFSPEPDAGIVAIEKLLLKSIGSTNEKGNGQ